MKKRVLTIIVLMGMSSYLYANSFADKEKACNDGKAIECFFIGVSYTQGKDVEKNHLKAAEFLGKACQGGMPIGCYNLGNMYARGQNNIKAKQLFKRACDGGIEDGCYNYKVLNKKK